MNNQNDYEVKKNDALVPKGRQHITKFQKKNMDRTQRK